MRLATARATTLHSFLASVYCMRVLSTYAFVRKSYALACVLSFSILCTAVMELRRCSNKIKDKRSGAFIRGAEWGTGPLSCSSSPKSRENSENGAMVPPPWHSPGPQGKSGVRKLRRALSVTAAITNIGTHDPSFPRPWEANDSVARPIGRPMGCPKQCPMECPMGRPMGCPTRCPMGCPMGCPMVPGKKSCKRISCDVSWGFPWDFCAPTEFTS